MTDEDDLDPSAWLAAQFGEEPAKPPAVPTVAPATPVEPPPVVEQPFTAQPFTAPPIAAPPFSPPPLVNPAPAPEPQRQQTPAAQPPANTFTPPATSASPQPTSERGGFQWGLTPGAEQAAPAPSPPAPTFPVEPSALPAAPAPAPDLRAQLPPAASLPADPSTVGFPAFVPPDRFARGPEELSARPEELPTQALEPVAGSSAQWHAAPLDPALEGVTEVFEAELVGLAGAQGENVAASSIDDLFGDEQFRDFTGEPLATPLAQRQAGGGGAGATAKAPREPRTPIPRTQKILLLVAGVLVAVLALVALYAVGMKVASLAPAPAIVPSASPSPTPSQTALAVGPVTPGSYHWDQLLGGECLTGFKSAWADMYTVVDCAAPHPAQLVFRGTFTDPASATYPGVDELQKRINLLCTPATIINYGIAGTVSDIQVQASYAADEADWDAGNHDYYCFVNRSGGGDLTSSVAIPQVAATPAKP